MHGPPNASLADELRAFGWLRPGDGATRALLLAMVRGTLPAEGDDRPPPVPAKRVRRDAPGPEGRAADSPPAPPPPPPVRAPADEPENDDDPDDDSSSGLIDATAVEPLGASASRPEVASAGMPIDRPPRLPQPVAQPILASRHARAVLSLLAATMGETDAPDLPRLMARLARGLPILRVPRRRALTTRRGVQLLIDCSAAMAPLAADREEVHAGMVRVLGAGRVDSLYFAGCPTRLSGQGARPSWTSAWNMPAPGVPVVVITTLGLVGSTLHEDWASPAEWRRFAERARANGNPLMVLSPFGAERCPPELAGHVIWVPWSEGLSAAKAKRLRRDAMRRGGR